MSSVTSSVSRIGGVGSSSSSNNVLSDKVQHAVDTVRVDSPAMRKALDALASSAFVVGSGSGGGGGGGSHHKKSVRVAIEEDALQQAYKLQKELRSIVECVSTLRQDVKEVTCFAHQVRESVSQSVLHHNSMDSSGKEMSEDDLALELKDAFEKRDAANDQYQSICVFMDKFDLSENDAYVLENTVLDASIVTPNDSNDTDGEGMAFLMALERVGKVQRELLHVQTTNTSTTDTNDSKHQMMATTTTTTTSAMRITETLATKQQKAFDRLYHFVQAYFDLDNTTTTTNIHTNSNVINNHRNNAPTSSKQLENPYHMQQQQQQQEEDLSSSWMEDALQMPFFQKALQLLQQIPHYHAHTLELIASNRRLYSTKKFLMALTTSGLKSSALEIKSHDPVAYTGEMLAFCFQSLLLESDLLHGLNLTNNNTTDEQQLIMMEHHPNQNNATTTATAITTTSSTLTTTTTSTTTPTAMTVYQVLNHIVSGVTRPLRSRIMHIISSLASRPDQQQDSTFTTTDDQHDPSKQQQQQQDQYIMTPDDEEIQAAQLRLSQLYDVCGLLLFYKSAMIKTVVKLMETNNNNNNHKDHDDINITTFDDDEVEENPLVLCINECFQEAARGYAASVRVYAANITSMEYTNCQPVHDILIKLCQVRTTSPGFDPNDDSKTNSNNSSIDASLLEALSLHSTCQILLDTALSHCTQTLEDASLLKLAVMACKKAGMNKETSAKWERQITTLERTMADDMIASDTKIALADCGLESVLQALQQQQGDDDDVPLAMKPGLSPSQLQAALNEFYASLYSPPLPLYESWKDPVLRKYARSKVAQNVVQAYADIYHAISQKNAGYNDLSFVGHEPEQVKALLSL